MLCEDSSSIPQGIVVYDLHPSKFKIGFSQMCIDMFAFKSYVPQRMDGFFLIWFELIQKFDLAS